VGSEREDGADAFPTNALQGFLQLSLNENCFSLSTDGRTSELFVKSMTTLDDSGHGVTIEESVSE
jgi:hypothetical protein